MSTQGIGSGLWCSICKFPIGDHAAWCSAKGVPENGIEQVPSSRGMEGKPVPKVEFRPLAGNSLTLAHLPIQFIALIHIQDIGRALAWDTDTLERSWRYWVGGGARGTAQIVSFEEFANQEMSPSQRKRLAGDAPTEHLYIDLR